ncbi:MAG TPA: T9SS type A sorting domain-containing protein, partial [Saprospiraceae bacterium]|nr:T9SS type A sorting domain-containing protein [Saprospiraceae bacterium]HRK84064.1 T9SS type A sorting domain-containing protein [Saprospiraceae bacterium]
TSFSNHATSLLLPDVNAILGSQTHTQNCWGANAGAAIYGTDENNPVPVEFAQEYPFTVDPAPVGNECFIPGEHFPMGWFREDIDFDPVNACDAELCVLNMFAPESDDVKRMALGDTSVSAAVMWDLQRYIYERLQGETVQNASVLAFLADSDTSSIGDFYAINRSISELLAADSLEVGQLQANLEMTEEKLDSLLLIDELLPEADSLELVVLQNDKNRLLNMLYELTEDNRNISEQLLDFISDEAAKLRAQNDSIAVTEIYEANEKEINDLYLSWLSTAFVALDSIEMASLQAIAEQCPIEGGSAVYRARAFWAALTREYVIYNDSLLCVPAELLTVRPDNGVQLQTAKNETGLRIFPNPAQTEINIAWKITTDTSGTLTVSDVFGRQVLLRTLAAGTDMYNLRVAELPEGVYIFRIRFQSWDAVRKIVISR